MSRFESSWEKEARKSRWEMRAWFVGMAVATCAAFVGVMKVSDVLFLHSHRENQCKERGYTPYVQNEKEYYLKLLGDTAVNMRYDSPGNLSVGNTYKTFDFKNNKVEIHNVTTTSSAYASNRTYTTYEDNKTVSFKDYGAGIYMETAVSQKELNQQMDVAKTFFDSHTIK